MAALRGARSFDLGFAAGFKSEGACDEAGCWVALAGEAKLDREVWAACSDIEAAGAGAGVAG